MSTPTGAEGHLGIRKEASFGSGGSIDNWHSFISETLTKTFANVYSDRVASTAEQVGGQEGNVAIAGDITFHVSAKLPIQWFQCGVGQSSSPFYMERPLPTMMIELDKQTAAMHASGCAIESLTFASTQGSELTCTAAIQAKDIASRTAGTPSYTASDHPYLHSDATFKLNGTDDTSVTAWSLTVNNTLLTDLYGTSKTRLDIPAAKMVVTGSFTKLFDDTIERNAFLNAEVRSFWAKFTRGSNFITFYCPKIRYNTRTDGIGGQSEYILETFEFTAFVDDPVNEKQLRISGDFS